MIKEVHQHYSVRYTSSATYFGLALSRDISSRVLKLVNANIPTNFLNYKLDYIIKLKHILILTYNFNKKVLLNYYTIIIIIFNLDLYK